MTLGGGGGLQGLCSYLALLMETVSMGEKPEEILKFAVHCITQPILSI